MAQSLPAPVEAALARARVPRSALSVVVSPVNSSDGALMWRAQEPLNPASLMKLATTYMALDQLGPAYTWPTQIYAQGKLEQGTLEGHLYLKGWGDPKLVIERLWLLSHAIQASGVRRVQGDIVIDHSAFEPRAHDPAAFDGQPWRPYNANGDAFLVNYKSIALTFTPLPAQGVAQVSAIPALAGIKIAATVPLRAGGCTDFQAALKPQFSPGEIRFAGHYDVSCGQRRWSVVATDPDSYAERAVQALWLGSGGELSGTVRAGQLPAGLPLLLEVQSPQLAEVLRDVNKFSNNVMAEQLFLTLSLQARGRGSLEASRELLKLWWAQRIGPSPAPWTLTGSGLSREERITAAGLAQLLRVAYASPWMPEFMSSLPIAGVDGTLRWLRDSASKGRAHLKTGSLNGVVGIAGYAHALNGRQYVVVAIINHDQAEAARPALAALMDWVIQGGL